MLERVSNTPVKVLDNSSLFHITFVVGLAMDNIVSMPVLRVVLALMYLFLIEHNLLKLILNMSKQVSSVATAAVQEANQPRVFNVLVAGARRNDATTEKGDTIEGINLYLRTPIPVIIDGEEVDVLKKWFRLSSVIDALIMSEDDSVAARVAAILDGYYMSIRGVTAKITVFEDENGELHHRLEF